MRKWKRILAALAILCGAAIAQTPGVSTILHSGATLPSGAKQYSVFVLTTGSQPQVYICNANPCTSSGQWVTDASGGTCSASCANLALSNLSAVAINTGLYSASGVDLTLGGATGTSGGTNPSNVIIQAGQFWPGSSQNGAHVAIVGGAAGSGTGGAVTITGGGTSNGGTTGGVSISSGVPSGSNSSSGGISIYTASPTGTGNSGNINISVPAGGTADGQVQLSNANASVIIGNTSPSSHGEIDFNNDLSLNPGTIKLSGMPFSYSFDNYWDFDLSTSRPKNMYVGTGIFIGGTTYELTGITSTSSGPVMTVQYVTGSNAPLCTSGDGTLRITTSTCPDFPTVTGSLFNGDYTYVTGSNSIGDSGVLAGPYPCQFTTFPTTSGTGDALSGTANKATIWKFFLQAPCTTTGATYFVGTAESSGTYNYDLALFNGAGTLYAHTGPLHGSVFSPSTGIHDVSWTSSAILQPGIIYLGLTSSCTSSCATLGGASGNAISRESNQLVSIPTGGTFTGVGSISVPGDSITGTANSPAVVIR